MANLKHLKNRMKSVKSTQKITSAMKLVAAAKLRRAQDNAIQARPYAQRMADITANLASKSGGQNAPILLAGNGKDQNHLLVVVSADRGLCGGFNGSIIRATRKEVNARKSQGKNVKLIMVGRKATDALRREFSDHFILDLEGIQGTKVEFNNADKIRQTIQQMIESGEVDSCSILYNKFVSAITQEVTFKKLVPAEIDNAEIEGGIDNAKIESGRGAEKTSGNKESMAVTEYEPNENQVLNDLLPRALATQIYAAILESSASELAARMTAMDNATRNAGDLLDRLTMQYNRTRQAAITTELIEIISGAEAL